MELHLRPRVGQEKRLYPADSPDAFGPRGGEDLLYHPEEWETGAAPAAKRWAAPAAPIEAMEKIDRQHLNATKTNARNCC